MLRRVLPALAAAALITGGGCYQDDGVAPANRQLVEPNIRVLLTDAPLFPYDQVARVDVYIVKIQASTKPDTGSNSQDTLQTGLRTIVAPHKSINVLALSNGVTADLGSGALLSGAYLQVRVTINTDSSSITLKDNTVLTNRNGIANFGPGEGGFNLFTDPPIGVTADGAVVVLDFYLGKTFQPVDPANAGAGFVFVGYGAALNTALTGSLTGTVRGEGATGAGGGPPIPNASVTLLQKNPYSPTDTATWGVFGTAGTDAAGTFLMAYVRPDTNYILLVGAPPSSPYGAAARAPVSIAVGAKTQLGDIVVPLLKTNPLLVIQKAAAANGDGQTGTVATALPNPLRVLVTLSGSPQPGYTVTWATAATGASVTPTQSVTDPSGVATAGVTLGRTAGQQTTTATLDGATGSPVTFTAIAMPGPASRLIQDSAGEYQRGLVNTALANPLSVKVVDQFGNGVSGVPVAWQVTSGSASVNPANTTSGASGIAQTTVTLGGTVGRVTITAASGALTGSPVTFHATAAALLTSVSSGGGSSLCGLTSAGAAYCWGYNGYGELGNGTTTNSARPAAVAGGLTFTTVSVGAYFACGLTQGGAAYCWGANSGGELGNGTTTNSATPVAVAGGLAFASISAGSQVACGLTPSGAAYCWGSGALGNGTTTPAAVAGGLTFAALSVGASNVCGVATTGAAYCWGGNSHGGLGDGTTTASATPVAVVGGLTFAAVSAGQGDNNACGVTTTGAAYCWGWNLTGQLGNGTTTDNATPIAVAGGLRFAAVSVGGLSTCAVTTSGVAYCWGWNREGELGNGTITGPQQCSAPQFGPFACSTTPVAVVGGLTFAALTAGSGTICGITTMPTAYCWGDNYVGELGQGTTGTVSDVPVLLPWVP